MTILEFIAAAILWAMFLAACGFFSIALFRILTENNEHK